MISEGTLFVVCTKYGSFRLLLSMVGHGILMSTNKYQQRSVEDTVQCAWMILTVYFSMFVHG